MRARVLGVGIQDLDMEMFQFGDWEGVRGEDWAGESCVADIVHGTNFVSTQKTLLNQNMFFALRLKLFHSIFFPTAMSGLALLPLTHEFLVQRRVLQFFVGFLGDFDF